MNSKKSKGSDDWRLKIDHEDLRNEKWRKITFPDFWLFSYQTKNNFYQKIKEEAEEFVRTMHRGEAFLEGEKVQAFWHEHCEFCTEKFMTDMQCDCYCTEKYDHWICEKCFEDLKEMFYWTVL